MEEPRRSMTRELAMPRDTCSPVLTEDRQWDLTHRNRRALDLPEVRNHLIIWKNTNLPNYKNFKFVKSFHCV